LLFRNFATCFVIRNNWTQAEYPVIKSGLNILQNFKIFLLKTSVVEI